MCGIVGYVGKRNAKDVVMSGLKRLEYRGYDSAGIALLGGNGELILNKSHGRLAALREKIEPMELEGYLGLGHTRWATHGAPTDQNAHPHRHGRVIVVHNGIIENYLKLKQELLALGHEFCSDTDTEIVAHLLNDLLAQGLDPLKALGLLNERLVGAFALGFLIDGDGDRLYFIRRGAPLIVARNDDECFFASDQAALVDFQPNYYTLNDHEMGYIERDKLGVFDSKGNSINVELKPLITKLDSIEKMGHSHFMHKEIFEQPETVRKVMAGRIANNEICIEAFGLDFERLNKVNRIEIVACGSAYFAGLVAKSFMEEKLGIPVQVEIASEYRYRKTLTDNNTLTIAISQSGETADTLAALEKAREQNALLMSVCNVVGSAVTRVCEKSIGNLFLHAGPEIAVASTKAFVGQMVALKLFALAWTKKMSMLSELREQEVVSAMLRLPEQLSHVLQLDEQISEIAKNLVNQPRMLYLGRGEMFPVALEGALKMKELSYIFAEGYPAGELKHGPIATINPGMPAVVIFGSQALALKTASNLQEIKARGAQVISISPGLMEDAVEGSDVVLNIGEAHDDVIAILATIPLQLLAFHLAVHKGLDADKPRNLAKSVTVE